VDEGGRDVFRAAVDEDLRAAGTLRFMFSRASRRSAWKSGWRNVQLCRGGKIEEVRSCR